MKWSEMPQQAPVWLWIAYILGMACLAVLAMNGGVAGFISVIMAASISFQFWTYVTHRGLTKGGFI